MLQRLRDALMSRPWGRGLIRIYSALEHHNAPLAASGMAFDTFLSLVPLLAFAGLVLHWLRQDGGFVLAPIANAAPLPVRQLFDVEYLRLTDVGAAAVAPISLLAFVWVISSGIATALSVFEVMFETPPRRWIVRRALATACVLTAILFVGVVAFVAFWLVRTLPSGLGKGLAVAMPTLVMTFLLAGFFRIAIPRPKPLRRVAVGVSVTLILWAATSALFSLYVATLARYATLYGDLATVAIFLFWLWLLALALLVGGEITAQLDGLRSDDEPPSSRMIGPRNRRG